MKLLLGFAALFAFLSLATAASPDIIVGYYPGWAIYARNFWVYDIDATKLTHINYAFANLGTDHRLLSGDPWADFQISYPGDDPNKPLKGNLGALITLKQRHPHLKTFISIGGWTWSGLFSNAALTEQTRRTFAASCVDWVQRYGFDGVDVDWEYPVEGGLDGNIRRPEDGVNYTLLLAEIRRQLDILGQSTGVHYLLTIAAPANPSIYRHYELDKLNGILDFINLMAYDYSGAWDLSTTGMNAPVYPDPADPRPTRATWNGDFAVKGYIEAGVSPEKLVFGVPFYGRGWAGVGPTNNGLYQSATSASPGTWEPGVLDYTDVRDNYIGRNGYQRYFNSPTNTSYTYSQQTGVFISYDDPQSIQIKGEYILNRNIRGAMVWDLSSDKGNQLMDALQRGLGGITPPPPPPPPPGPTPNPDGCTNCTPGTSGPCQHAAVGDYSCYPELPDGSCPPGTIRC